MQLDRQIQFTGAIKYKLYLSRCKGDALTESVDRIDQPLSVGGIQRRQTNLLYIVVFAFTVFCRCGVRAEKACPNAHRAHGFDLPCNAQHFQFGFDIQPVAGFHFYRADALGDQCVDAWQRVLQQLRFAVLARGIDGRDDAAAGAREFLVACPLQAHFEFARTIAAEHQVGVAVDQCRCNQPPVQCLCLPRAILIGQVGQRATPLNGAISDGDSRLVDQSIDGLIGLHGGDARMGQQRRLRHG